MNNRIKNIFLTKKKKLITFITAGDPNLDYSRKILENLPKYGVDIMEIGMPFSDPMADGPTIQLASSRAIKNKVDLNKVFNLCKNVRKTNKKTPIILMGYYNPILHFGNSKFINECKKAGVDGLIIVDLQPENDKTLFELARRKKIDFIRLITPTTTEKRLKEILINASGFLYYVSITGVTGAKLKDFKKVEQSIKKIKKKTKLPIVVGFGIKTKEQVQKIFKFADGVVIGSSIVEIIEKKGIKNSKIENILLSIKKFINVVRNQK
tara:strand:+ start:1369 stop:2166 length:798 start_codon:yes stop_codon:yes gene_type:complete